MPHLSNAWRSKVRTVLVRTQQTQRVDDVLCKRVHLHMAPVDLLFVQLVLLRGCETMNHTATLRCRVSVSRPFRGIVVVGLKT